MKNVLGLGTGLIIFLIGFYPVRFLGDTLAMGVRANFGETYLINLVMFFFPFLLSLLSAFTTYLISGKQNKTTLLVFMITALILILKMGHALIP